MNIVVSGSLAYDRIMNFPGYFSDHILPEKIHVLNVSFHVDGVFEKFGGTAGNIAYALSLLGAKPFVVATIGRDFQRYFEWLKKNRIPLDYIKIIDDDLTASANIMTDKADNQITGFNPGAMKYPTAFDFSKVKPEDTIVVIAPGNLADMRNYSRICKARGINYIFDPGQSLPAWEKDDLKECIQGASILISNDYELELIMSKSGLAKNSLCNLCRTVITTFGEKGSKILTGEDEIPIPVAKPRKVVDPTGAGDAYRGGLIMGLTQGKGIEESAVMGSVCASFCVEVYGTQDYTFTPEEFNSRLSQYLK